MKINNLKQTSLIKLMNRLNELEKVSNKVDEYNEIIYELYERIPTLKEEETMQPKVLKKEKIK